LQHLKLIIVGGGVMQEGFSGLSLVLNMDVVHSMKTLYSDTIHRSANYFHHNSQAATSRLSVKRVSRVQHMKSITTSIYLLHSAFFVHFLCQNDG
jgi:hypothetical protein